MSNAESSVRFSPVSPVTDATFVAVAGTFGMAGLFGGQLMALATRAGMATSPADWMPYSLHATFLAGGSEGEPVQLTVEQLRNGKRSCHRAITISQQDAIVAEIVATFGPELPAPDEPSSPVLSEPTTDASDTSAFHTRWHYDEFDLRQPSDRSQRHDRFHPVWAKLAVPADQDNAEGWAAAAFLSDLGVVLAAMDPEERRMTIAISAEHSIWFHRRPDFREWHLLQTTRELRTGGRAVVSARITDAHGRVVALATQGVLVL